MMPAGVAVRWVEVVDHNDLGVYAIERATRGEVTEALIDLGGIGAEGDSDERDTRCPGCRNVEDCCR